MEWSISSYFRDLRLTLLFHSLLNIYADLSSRLHSCCTPSLKWPYHFFTSLLFSIYQGILPHLLGSSSASKFIIRFSLAVNLHQIQYILQYFKLLGCHAFENYCQCILVFISAYMHLFIYTTIYPYVFWKAWVCKLFTSPQHGWWNEYLYSSLWGRCLSR